MGKNCLTRTILGTILNHTRGPHVQGPLNEANLTVAHMSYGKGPPKWLKVGLGLVRLRGLGLYKDITPMAENQMKKDTEIKWKLGLYGRILGIDISHVNTEHAPRDATRRTRTAYEL